MEKGQSRETRQVEKGQSRETSQGHQGPQIRPEEKTTQTQGPQSQESQGTRRFRDLLGFVIRPFSVPHAVSIKKRFGGEDDSG